MASNPLYAALESLFVEDGAVPNQAHQPLTLRTLIRGLETWSPGTRLELAQLEQLRGRVTEAVRQTEADLQHDRDEELAGYLQEMLSVYRELASRLQALTLALELSVSDKVQAELLQLTELHERLVHGDQAVQEWRAREVSRCLRCGRAESGQCPICSLETLYYDPDAGTRGPSVSTQLGPEYTAVFAAWQAVGAGDASLSALWAPVESLERLLRGYLRMTQHELTLGMAGEKVTRTLKRIALAAQQSLAGLAQMRSAQTTGRARDLNEGWLTVFEFAVEIQESIPELARALGKQPPSAAGVDVQDSLLIDFD